MHNGFCGEIISVDVQGDKEVLGAGVEPALVSQHGPQPCASANSATRAAMAQKVILVLLKSTTESEKNKKLYFI